jgi:hypothetical protein
VFSSASKVLKTSFESKTTKATGVWEKYIMKSFVIFIFTERHKRDQVKEVEMEYLQQAQGKELHTKF